MPAPTPTPGFGAVWRLVKDGLCLPLLVGVYRQAGLPPPVGLLVLPLELQMAVLRLLPVREQERSSSGSATGATA